MNTIALCIPAYNAGKFLPRLLSSAQNQSIPFNEIFVYNDCSTDDTAAIAKEFGATVISGDSNRGCSYGKNKLAETTICDWIHFHDADDDLLPNFTTEMHSWLNTNADNYDVLLLNFNYIDAYTGEYLGSAYYDKNQLHNDPLKYAIQHKIVNFGLYKRQSFLNAGGFNLNKAVLYNEDNALHQRLARHGLKFDCLTTVTCINYRYSNSMSSSNQLKCAQANYHVLAETATTHGHIYHQELSDQLFNCATNLAAVQNWEYVKKALALCAKLGHKYPATGSTLFKFLNNFGPFNAIWLREKLIRLFKPSLRNNSHA